MSNTRGNLQNLEEKDFASLGVPSTFVSNKIQEINLKYLFPSKEQRDEIILKLVQYLLSDDVVVSGSHRKIQWEDGWLENLNEYLSSRDLNSIIPKYFDKSPEGVEEFSRMIYITLRGMRLSIQEKEKKDIMKQNKVN